MILTIDKSFEKDTDAIDSKRIKTSIARCIIDLQNAQRINQIKNLKKLKGSRNEYRIRIGDYRLGIRIVNDVITLIRCLHRKEIYRYFPK